jgi:hypothetical protein
MILLGLRFWRLSYACAGMRCWRPFCSRPAIQTPWSFRTLTSWKGQRHTGWQWKRSSGEPVPATEPQPAVSSEIDHAVDTVASAGTTQSGTDDQEAELISMDREDGETGERIPASKPSLQDEGTKDQTMHGPGCATHPQFRVVLSRRWTTTRRLFQEDVEVPKIKHPLTPPPVRERTTTACLASLTKREANLRRRTSRSRRLHRKTDRPRTTMDRRPRSQAEGLGLEGSALLSRAATPVPCLRPPQSLASQAVVDKLNPHARQ